ncbi:DNA repair protein rad18 [Thozetella sp. PMI_491]|nr:DNA repair protein rad18 [Thozetella sp. PMI_491]
MDDPFDVPDSTDWLGTALAGLMPVEQTLRCHVCKDFFNSPMLTSCNHTFCSLCIRRSLAVDGKCPLCRASDQESKLRGNWAMREVVEAFNQARPVILQFAKAPPAPATPKSPKRKANDAGPGSQGSHESKRPRMSTRSSKAKAMESMAAIVSDEIDVPESKDTAEYEPDDGLVSCPICLARMKEHQVDKHLDTSCPGSPQPQGQQESSSSGSASGLATNWLPSQSTTPKAPERLPTLAYSMMKESVLRKKLSDLGISNGGNKQMLERRHREWVMLWNANCDSSHPKRRSELLQDLETWERTMGSRAPMTSRAANMGAQIKDKEFDGAAWAARHDTSFKELIANARKSKKQAEQKAKEEANSSETLDAGQRGGEEAGKAVPTSSGLDTATALDPAGLDQHLPNSDVVDLTSSPPIQQTPTQPAAGYVSTLATPQAMLHQPSIPTGEGVLVGTLNGIPNILGGGSDAR